MAPTLAELAKENELGKAEFSFNLLDETTSMKILLIVIFSL